MYDDVTDKEQEEIWKRELTGNRSMPIGKMAKLAVYGFHTCEGHCFSREHCSEDSCECIRSVFPSPTHYELYLLLRTYVTTAQIIRTAQGGND